MFSNIFFFSFLFRYPVFPFSIPVLSFDTAVYGNTGIPPKTTHHCILYDRVGWPSLVDRPNKHWYQFIFKTIDGTIPLYLKSLLEWDPVTYRTRSSSSSKSPQQTLNWGRQPFALMPQTLGMSYSLNSRYVLP